MAKRTLEQLEADEQKLMKQLEDIRAGKRDAAKADADEAKTILQDALAAYNKLATAAGVSALRLVSDAERATAAKPAKASGGKRLRLDDDKVADISSKVVKAAKAHGKDGASKQDILTYLKTNGYELGHHFNEPHLFKIITSLRGGDEPSIKVTGEKGGMRYHAA